MEGCSKTSAAAVFGLPDDPLVEILSGVPAKSVCRFKCVSKGWRDLIADPDHRKKLRQPMQGLFFQSYKFEVDDDGSEVDDDESEVDDDGSEVDDDGSVYGKLDRISFIDLTMGSVPLEIDPYCFSFLTEMTGIDSFLLDSCNGLILLGQCRKSSCLLDGYIICNPTTRQWSAVPTWDSREALSHTFLAFDPVVSSHFHLVQFQVSVLHTDVVSLHVYSSESRTWSQNQIDEQKDQGELKGWHHQFTLDPMKHHCAFVNGFLHSIVWGSHQAGAQILAVDIQGKARRMITVPRMADEKVHKYSHYVFYLGQSQGHLHCVTRDEKGFKLYIWVLQDYDTQEWVLKNTVNSLDVFGESIGMAEWYVVDIHQDRNVVFLCRQGSSELIAYNIDHKEVSVMGTFKDINFRSEFARYIPYFSESPALTNKY